MWYLLHSYNKFYLPREQSHVLTVVVGTTATQLQIDQANECQSSDAQNRLGEMITVDLSKGL